MTGAEPKEALANTILQERAEYVLVMKEVHPSLPPCPLREKERCGSGAS